MANKIFISYSRQDEYFARALAVDLEECGAEIWIDVEDIPVGSRWSSAIQEGLSESQVMLLIASPDAMASTNVEDEWNYFLDKNKPIIVVYWRTCEAHFQLWRIPRIEFRQQKVGYHTALPVLIKQLKSYGVHLNIPHNLPTLSDSFMRQALRRALSDAAQSPLEESNRFERFQTGETVRPDRRTKPIQFHPQRRPLRIFLLMVVLAILLVSAAVYIRFVIDRSPQEIMHDLRDDPQASPEQSTPTSEVAATLELAFNSQALYLRNISNRPQNVSGLIFRQTGAEGEIYEYEAFNWQTIYAEANVIYALQPERCFQIGISNQAAQAKPEACLWVDSWFSPQNNRFYFWLAHQDRSFSVFWENRLVTTCPIEVGICRFNLDSFR